ncbi:MAG: thioredoxin family protein [Thermoanaerobaculia bacterium]
MGGKIIVPLALLVVLSTACDPSADRTVQTADGGHAEIDRVAIDWAAGTVEEAFALAKELNKPLFLYWGAVWCPPCHYLKEKIFKHPEFVEQSRNFVTVYLDGDTDRAQEWGERLGIAGYPTVLVLDPNGEEVMRMTAGIPVEEYNGVLAAALQSMRPIKEVLEEVMAAGVAGAASMDLELLANYSWGQDTVLELSDEEQLETFRELYQGTPPVMAVEKSKFLAYFLEAAGRAASDEERAEPVVAGDQRAALRAGLLELLGDRGLRNSNVFFVAFSGPSVVDLLEPEPEESREALIDAWDAGAAAMEEDDALSVTDRLYAVNSRVRMTRARMPEAEEGEETPPLPDELLALVRAHVARADEAVTDAGELQSAMNVMAGLLVDAGLAADAKALVAERLDDTLAPHYYMSWMASLEEDEGNSDEALAWSRRAYDDSEGPYTRFQWGVSYLRDVMRLAPEDVDTVEQASSEVLSALLALDDAFANRNWTRWQGLEKAFRAWGEDGRGDAVARIRDTVLGACDRFAEGGGEDSPRTRCGGFLADDEDIAS